MIARPQVRSRVALAAVAAIALAIAGCGSTNASQVDAAVDAFQASAEAIQPVGAFMMLQVGDQDVHFASYGTTEIGGDEEPRASDHIRVGSVTKTWTGTVILQLAEEGKLSLLDPVSKFRNDIPDGDGITIEMLLTMQSGLYNYTFDPTIAEAMDSNPETVFDPEYLLGIAVRHTLNFVPGSAYEYSNTNTVLLGLIAEQLEGKSLSQLIQERVFDSAGVRDSVFPMPADNQIPEPYARGYSFGTNVETLDGSPALTPEEVEAYRAGELMPTDRTFDNPSWGWAAGAGISTASDLAVLARAMTDGSLLGEEYQDLRLQSFVPQSADAPPQAPRYGLALVDFAGFIGHTGELPGYNTFATHDPDRGITLVVWANLAPTGDGIDPATQMARAIIDQLGTAND